MSKDVFFFPAPQVHVCPSCHQTFERRSAPSSHRDDIIFKQRQCRRFFSVFKFPLFDNTTYEESPPRSRIRLEEFSLLIFFNLLSLFLMLLG